MLDVRRLRLLRELAQQGTIAATAKAMGYSPPAVSQQIAALEREVGTALLERHGRGRRLTEAGRELVVRSEAIFGAIEAAEAAVAGGKGEIAGALRCAAFPSALRGLMVPAIATLAAWHPALRVVTHELEPEESVPALRRRELDLVLVQDYAFAPLTPDSGIERRAIADDPVRLAMAADRAMSGPVTLADLAAEQWVAGRDGTWCHAVVLHAARTAGFEPRIAHRTNDFSIAYALVAAGAAVALIPALAGPPPAGVRLCAIDELPLTRRVFAATRSGSADHPAIRALLGALTGHDTRLTTELAA